MFKQAQGILLGSSDPLEDLLVDKDEINREKLSSVLKGVIGIDQDTGDPVFRSSFSDLSTKEKTTYYLLYRQAANNLGKLEGELGIESKNLAEEIGTNYNTTRSILSKSNYTSKDDNGYLIPAYSLEDAINAVGGDKDE